MTELGSSDVSGEERIRAFLDECAERLTTTAEAPPAAEGAAALARALARSTPLPFEPRWLEALDTFHSVDPNPLGELVTDRSLHVSHHVADLVADGELDLIEELANVAARLLAT